MSLCTQTAAHALAHMAEFDAIIDARSEDEFALDHLPGAVNWPTLNNAERISIGTLYTQVNPFEARKRGAAMAARNIAGHIDRHVIGLPRDWKPLAYCWRGGQRSGSLSMVLGQIGFRVTLLEGGYKAFRAAMVQDIGQRVAGLRFQVVCGPTGSGKTRLLQALDAQGAQVLDLEALANHRSSVLGAMPGLLQPSQKRFDTLVWDRLRSFNALRPVFVESESKKVGNLSVPLALMDAMRAAPCLTVQLPDPQRVALLLEDYDYLVRDVNHFCQRLAVLASFRGHALVARWQAQARAGEFAPVVLELLTQHYDPAYRQSLERNFVRSGAAITVAPYDHSMGAMSELSQQVMALCG